MKTRARVLSFLSESTWALKEDVVRQYIEIAKSENITFDTALGDKSFGGDVNFKVDGNVALLDISGPLMKRGGMLDAFCGLTSYSRVAKSFDTLMDADEIDTIVLNIDSPGGQVSGLEPFADRIFGARDRKKIVAFTDGQASSAAYWIASAAHEIYLTESAYVGSIGVVAAYPVKDDGYVEVTSTQSPDKRLDVETDEGYKKIQAHVSELAEVFIGRVARNRGVTSDTVINDFGHGGVLIGQKAVDAGMADGITDLDALVTKLKDKESSQDGGIFNANNEENEEMDLETLKANHPDLVTAIQNEAVENAQGKIDEQLSASKERINAILNSEEAKGREELAKHLAFNTEGSVEEAKGTLAVASKAVVESPFEKAMENDEDINITESNSDASAKDQYGDPKYWGKL